jgi:membrane protein implicated in regulation of membrane protease activity
MRSSVGALTPFLDDLLLGAALLLLVLLLAPEYALWAVLGLVFYTGFKVWLFRAHFRRPAIGVEAMAGRIGTALEDLRPRGPVRLDGEIWEAESTEPVRAGERVQVASVEGLLLHVAPVGVIGPIREPPPRSLLLALAERFRRQP